MNALVLIDYHKFSYEKVARPAIGSTDLLVRLKAAAICGSDVRGIDGSTGRRIPPIIMGHEAAGIVVETGKGVTHFQVGDRVTFDSTIYCGQCGYCKQGRVNLCEARRVYGVSCDEYRQNGAFAEYIAVPERIAYRLPADLPFEQAALVEPVAIALHGVRLARPELNETALVYGTGVIGLITIQLLRLTGSRRIFAVDLDAHKLEMAARMGATDCVQVDQKDPNRELRSRLGKEEVDVLIELVGSGNTVATAIDIVRKGGRLVQVGNFSPRLEIPLQKFVTKEIQYYGSNASAGEYRDSLDLIGRQAVDVASLISAVVPLSEGASWFKRLYNREAGLFKVVLQPGK